MDSIIRFGNLNSPLQLTILTNPYCYPCSVMHKRIEGLLQKNGNIGVQYVLSSFAEELNPTNKYLIAACLADTHNIAQIFTDWFEKGIEDRQRDKDESKYLFIYVCLLKSKSLLSNNMNS